MKIHAVPRDLTEEDFTVIIRMARARAALMGTLKEALEAGDDRRALEIAREVCGLAKKEKV